MNKEYFLRELSFLLQDLEEEEREAALQYYRDCLEEAGPEREAELLEHIGSPEKAAAEIRSGLAGDTQGGEYTERGYYDERFDEHNRVPDRYAAIEKYRKKRNGRNGLLLLLLFLFFGLPLAGTILGAGFSVLAAVVGGLLGIFGGLFGLIVGAFSMTVALAGAGVGMILAGAANLMTPPVGLMGICLGFFLLCGAFLLAAVAKWSVTTAAPGLLRFCVSAVQRCWSWCVRLAGRLFDRMFGRGGAAK